MPMSSLRCIACPESVGYAHDIMRKCILGMRQYEKIMLGDILRDDIWVGGAG